MTVEQKINHLVTRYTKLCGTNDPFKIAEMLNIHLIIEPLGNASGYYRCMKRIKFIFLNENIMENEASAKVVMAHELGHALLHRIENCCFMSHHTLLLTSHIEREANRFAAELLITDDMLKEFTGCTVEQFCSCTGYPKELMELRIKERAYEYKGKHPNIICRERRI